MSSPRIHLPAVATAAARTQQLHAVTGAVIRDERVRRGWALRELARRSRLSAAMVQAIESGAAASVDAYVRLTTALGLRLEIDVVDPSRRDASTRQKSVDVVHSAMGEFETAHLRPFGFGVGIDEPYQHFQFAGRADVTAWDLERRALLHLENRTQFPDFQATAGSYNAKRAYLGSAIAERLGIKRWVSETHVVVGLWSAEVLHEIRLRTESFRALCPDPADVFDAWWSGRLPAGGRTSALIILDPTTIGRQRAWVTLSDAMRVRPRHRGYAETAAALSSIRSAQ